MLRPRDHNNNRRHADHADQPASLPASYFKYPPYQHKTTQRNKYLVLYSQLTSGRFPFLGSPLWRTDRFSGPDHCSKEHRRARRYPPAGRVLLWTGVFICCVRNHRVRSAGQQVSNGFEVSSTPLVPLGVLLGGPARFASAVVLATLEEMLSVSGYTIGFIFFWLMWPASWPGQLVQQGTSGTVFPGEGDLGDDLCRASDDGNTVWHGSHH